MPVATADTATVKKFAKQFTAAGCEVKYDRTAGTMEAKDGETVIYKALQKGKGQPWIVRYQDGETVKFK